MFLCCDSCFETRLDFAAPGLCLVFRSCLLSVLIGAYWVDKKRFLDTNKTTPTFQSGVWATRACRCFGHVGSWVSVYSAVFLF